MKMILLLLGMSLVFCLFGLSGCVSGGIKSGGPKEFTTGDYELVLKKAVFFYDANKCGKDVKVDNIFPWRGECHLTDGKDVGLDLTGGFHDAGDHVKFGISQGYTAFVLGWSLYEYKDLFNANNLSQKLISILKYFTDYFLACYPDPETFYYQIGDGNRDHRYWGEPEEQRGDRQVKFTADPEHPASDVCGVTSAALAVMYLNYNDIDPEYAEKCLKAAKDLYVLGKTYPGLSSGQSFYNPNNLYDDLALAAAWLYSIEKDDTYIKEIDYFLSIPTKYYNDVLVHNWTLCWDDTYLGVFIKMAEMTGDRKYKDAVMYNLQYWMNDLQSTAGGLKYLQAWGVLRYAAAEAMCALLYYKQTGDESLKAFARSQIDYILGKNPEGISYVIGFGDKYPANPHHRAASMDEKYILEGALVGGPDEYDEFDDDIELFMFTEVAIDYNAGLVGALAGMAEVF